MSRPRVVVVGAGFGGIAAVHALRHARADITLIDKANHHLFQPLLYQVATAGLSPANIAWPVRSVFKKRRDVTTVMAEVFRIDRETKTVHHSVGTSEYDVLIVATGSTHSWFGNDTWENHATGLKTVCEATQIRNRLLTAFEMAEVEPMESRRRQLMTAVVVGGGPTGVETAGAIAELSRRVLANDFRRIDPTQTRIVLIEAADRLLLGFTEELGKKARTDLEKFGVEVHVNSPVNEIGDGFVQTQRERFETNTVVWAAGVRATPAAEWLGVTPDRQGRVVVDARCQLEGTEDIFVIGDVANFKGENGFPLPGVASVAIQQGEYVAKLLTKRFDQREETEPFIYKDPGSMATIGRSQSFCLFA